MNGKGRTWVCTWGKEKSILMTYKQDVFKCKSYKYLIIWLICLTTVKVIGKQVNCI